MTAIPPPSPPARSPRTTRVLMARASRRLRPHLLARARNGALPLPHGPISLQRAALAPHGRPGVAHARPRFPSPHERRGSAAAHDAQRGRRGPQRGRRRSCASRAGLRATRLLLRFEHPTPRLLRRRPKDPHRSRGLHPFRGRGRYPFVSAPGKPPPRSLRRHAQRHLPVAEHVLLELRPGSVASRV